MMQKLDLGRDNLGLTLLELIISMALGVILTGAVMQIFVSIKDSGRVIEVGSEVQQNGRFTIGFMSNSIQLAGFREVLSEEWEQEFPADGSFAVGQIINGTEGGANPDSILVRYQGYSDGMTLDCLGNNVAAGTNVTVSYSVDGCGNLVCSVDGAPGSIIVGGIEALEIKYGEDLTGDGEVNAYLDADDVTDWLQVRSVKLGALVASNSATGSIDNQRTYTVLGNDITVDDDLMREVFAMTIGLKNMVK